MTKTDKEYLSLLSEIMEKGVEKDTRAGRVKSVFGRQLRFNLKDGLPLLTTKKVFTKGIIHELLWFLQRPYNSHGSSNIEYLVRNNVHIWDDDAFRWFKEWVTKEIAAENKNYYFVTALIDDELKNPSSVTPKAFDWWIENQNRKGDIHWLLTLDKEEFLDLVLQKVEIRVEQKDNSVKIYRFGDLGPVYGTQWRDFNHDGIDQITNIINTLKTNPNDRRMLCLAYNPSKIGDMALPPCHVMFQFYTRELTTYERLEEYKRRCDNGECFEEYEKAINPWNPHKDKDEVMKKMDESDVPKYGLNCMFTMRSNDYMCGTSFNWVQYAILTYMIANIVNMVPDELIYNVGDCHIYLNHMDGAREQLQRNGSDVIPKLVIHGKHNSVEDFKFEDFEIKDYYPDPPIKFVLNVG